MVNDTLDGVNSFHCLSNFCRWSTDDKRLVRAELHTSIARHINSHHTRVEHYRDIINRYTTSRHSQRSHHKYTEAEIDTFSLTPCKRIVEQDMFGNSFHFIGSTDRQFTSYAELRQCTKKNWFLLDEARADTAMKALLKTVT